MSDERNQDDVKSHIERAINRAREGVGEHVDELDRHLRESLNLKKAAGEHAPELMAAGAAFGFLAGFGAPKKLTRVLQIAIPLLIVGKIAASRFGSGDEANDSPAGTDSP